MVYITCSLSLLADQCDTVEYSTRKKHCRVRSEYIFVCYISRALFQLKILYRCWGKLYLRCTLCLRISVTLQWKEIRWSWSDGQWSCRPYLESWLSNAAAPTLLFHHVIICVIFLTCCWKLKAAQSQQHLDNPKKNKVAEETLNLLVLLFLSTSRITTCDNYANDIFFTCIFFPARRYQESGCSVGNIPPRWQ